MGFASSGMKRCRSSSMSSSIECINEIQYLCPNLKKQKVDYRLSFSSSLGKEKINRASGVMGSVTDIGGEKKQRVDQVLGFSSSLCKEKRAASEVMGCVSDGGEKNGDVGFSDSTKAARAEMLKKRFGRIIMKAEEFQVEEDRSGKTVDSVEMQKRKNLILEKKLKEAEIAAEVASKMELHRKREAARKALLELEKSASVEIDDNISTMKDFATLLGYPQNCAADCVSSNGVGWYGLCFSNTSRTSDWRKR